MPNLSTFSNNKEARNAWYREYFRKKGEKNRRYKRNYMRKFRMKLKKENSIKMLLKNGFKWFPKRK